MRDLLARVERRANRLAKWLPAGGIAGWVLTLAAWQRANEEGTDLDTLEAEQVHSEPTHAGIIHAWFDRIRARRAEADQTLRDFEG